MRRTTRRVISIIASVGLVAGMLAVTTGTTSAEPSTPRTLTYHFTGCTGPGPAAFDAVKQPGGAAALHIVDGDGTFIAMESTDVESGAILFMTPGFDHNNLPTITCSLIHPALGTLQSVTGIIAPIG